jgi:HlyD family secretion protein
MRLQITRRVIGTTAVVVVVSLSALQVSRTRSQTARPVDALPTATVQRALVDGIILAQGEVQSSHGYSVQCELESLGAGAQGRDSSSTILYLIPEGSAVKEGELLCELDASNYEDLYQQQELKVLQARAEKKQAEIDVEIAKIGALEFKEGLCSQAEKAMQGKIAMAASEVQRATDRFNWSRQMKDKGYLSGAQVETERGTLDKAKLNTELAMMSEANQQRFSIPKQSRGFESQIAGAEAMLRFQTMRLNREEERLELYKRQVERCTIRAPHDGMVTYANEAGKPAKIYEEAPVRQRQKLFILPDLTQLELTVYLHDTVVAQIEIGMQARIQVEALPEIVDLAGKVIAVGQMPLFDKGQQSSNEVKIYRGRVELDQIPPGLLPGMTAQVRIETGERPNALVVPSEAVTIERGHELCYVVRGDHLERQPVVVSAATSKMLEVTQGLNEGDRVVLSPVVQGLSEHTQAPTVR